MIIGAKGISLLYVTWEYDTPYPTDRQPWESMETLAAHNYGSAYNQDKLMVQNLIIWNIVDGSDAYT